MNKKTVIGLGHFTERADTFRIVSEDDYYYIISLIPDKANDNDIIGKYQDIYINNGICMETNPPQCSAKIVKQYYPLIKHELQKNGFIEIISESKLNNLKKEIEGYEYKAEIQLWNDLTKNWEIYQFPVYMQVNKDLFIVASPLSSFSQKIFPIVKLNPVITKIVLRLSGYPTTPSSDIVLIPFNGSFTKYTFNETTDQILIIINDNSLHKQNKAILIFNATSLELISCQIFFPIDDVFRY